MVQVARQIIIPPKKNIPDKSFTSQRQKSKKSWIENAWRIFASRPSGELFMGIVQGLGELNVLASTADTDEEAAEGFSCCCGKGGDCILAISVVDEDTTLGYRNPVTRDNDYANLRALYPNRNLVLFRPQAPPAWYCGGEGAWAADCSIYTAADWKARLQEENVPFGPLVLPEGWGEQVDENGNDLNVDYYETVLREEGDSQTADDWFDLLLSMGVIDPNGGDQNNNSGKVIITPSFGKIALFLDNSGSMTEVTVRGSLELFKERLREEMDISEENDRLLLRPGASEMWIAPHSVERPDESCINEPVYGEVISENYEWYFGQYGRLFRRSGADTNGDGYIDGVRDEYGRPIIAIGGVKDDDPRRSSGF